MKPGEYGRTKVSLLGTAQGPSKAHGDGELCEIPAGGICEVFDVEHSTGWLTLHYELEENGPHEPYRCEAIAFGHQVEHANHPPLPPMIPEGTPDIQ